MRIAAWKTLFIVMFCLGLHVQAAKAQEPIRGAAEDDFPPFSVVDKAGQADGFAVELLRAALAAMGREVSFRLGQWSEVRGWLEKGEVQALPLVGRTPEREAIFDFTFPYMSVHGAIVVREESRGIVGLDDLRGKEVAVMSGDNAEEFLRREERGINIHTTPSFEVALRELAQGLHDAVVVQRLVALRLIQEGGHRNLKIIDRPIEDFRQDFCFAVREGDRDTLALLNEGLALVMADGAYRRLHAKWFAALELGGKGPIVIGGDQAYPPYEYLDEEGRPAGYNVDLSRAIARRMGLEIEIRLGPWPEMREALARGEIDVLQGMFFSHARNRTFDFSQPHLRKDGVAVVRAGRAEAPATLPELVGKRIVVAAGDIMHDFALENGLGEYLTVVDTPETALRELAEGRHDCALLPRLSAHYWIKRHGWENLRVGKGAPLTSDYSYAVRKGDSALLAQLGEGLKAIGETGEYKSIQERWMGVREDSSADPWVIFRYVAMVAGPLCLLALAFYLWSWSLRKQVAKRVGELREREAFIRAVIDNLPVGIAVNSVSPEVKFSYMNDNFPRFYGTTREALQNPDTFWEEVYEDPVFREEIKQRVVADCASGDPERMRWDEVPITRKGKEISYISAVNVPVPDKGLVISLVWEITELVRASREKEKLRGQLLQAQKMESVGRLAGGVAHDFNNMLTVIMCNAEYALAQLPPGAPLHDGLEEIHKAAVRSAALTRQLLAFARKQVIDPKVLELNETVAEMLKMLQRLIGEDVNLLWKPGPAGLRVKMDPSQLDQILVNLCVNARDAIKDIGKITIESDVAVFDEDYCFNHPGFVPGDYVLLAVSDDGCGMDRATLELIFDPFFTTKEQGQGTGLGLATVYGIVKQNNGFINVYSEPGKGTTFRIYLPPFTDVDVLSPKETAASAPLGQGETVLVVEDEPALLKLTSRMLDQLGYTVLAAGSPKAALALVAEHHDAIKALLTDVVMPGMNGRELAERLRRFCPEIGVVFMSGYTANVIAHHGVLDEGVIFLPKPFSKEDLAMKIHEAIS